ncbi:hypothetical protein M5K25_015832 [Dendrobium thyrsiflorum]|uniref:Oligopeptide transporter 5 n=1 Tax=Dendrobium thyrsiflorum TaxID=117978 RepID=A0ABD0UZB7_DENTH
MGEVSVLSPPSGHQESRFDFNQGWQVEENDHPIEEVRLTVDPSDNPNIPALTFRTWLIGVISCVLLSFANMFFGYRTNQLSVGSVCIQIIALPIGRFLAATLPKKEIKFPFTNRSFSLNPGPFSMKEHCLITIFASAGAGGLYAIHIVTIVKAFYHRNIHPMAAFLLAQTTQLLGFGWAGIYRKYLVESPYMWWPANLVQVSLFKALHLEEKRKKGAMTRFQFFLVVFITSFAYYSIPGFIFPAISSVSILCLIFKKSITMQQIGSGLKGLGIGSFGIDWSTVAGFLGSPLATPASAIINTMFGFFIGVYVLIPIGYWTNTYNAKRFPMISSHVFDYTGHSYNTTRIINDKTFTLNPKEEESYSKINLSITFALLYGTSFATLTASIMHVALHNGKTIWKMWKETKEYSKAKMEDVHTRLMKKNYAPVPQYWFYVLLVFVIGLSIFTCEGFNRQLQLPWWGVLFACIIALLFTLPIGVILATTNMAPGLNVITEYIFGLILPGNPMANVTFKTYGTISMGQALTLLSDLNLGHYMKIPPKSMFIVQLTGTMIASSTYFATAWFLLETVKNICDPKNLPQESPWTCPNDDVFYNASIIWGLVGPVRMFGKLGHYSALNFCFLIGLLLPIPFWYLSKVFPRNKLLRYIHIPLIIAGIGGLLPPHSVNYIMYKEWWARHTYVMSAALDAGVAFMGIFIFFALQFNNISGIDWWGGVADDYCPLASCPTAPEVVIEGCPAIKPDVLPDHHQRPDVLPDHHQRPDVLPDHHQKPDVLPDHHQRPDVLPDHHLRPDILPDHNLTPNDPPDHHQRLDILPDHHLRLDVLPDHHLMPDVLPDHHVRPDDPPNHHLRPDVLPDHHLRPDVLPDRHLRPDVLPDHHLRPDVLPDRHLRPEVLPDHHPRPDVLPDHHLRPNVLPDNHLRPDVLPDHHLRPDVLPDCHLTPDVLPECHLMPDVPPNHLLMPKGCRLCQTRGRPQREKEKGRREDSCSVRAPKFGQGMPPVPDQGKASAPDVLPDHHQRPDVLPNHHQRPDVLPDHHQRPDVLPDHHQRPDVLSDHHLRLDIFSDHNLTPDNLLDHHQRPDVLPEHHLRPDVLPDHHLTPDVLPEHHLRPDDPPDHHLRPKVLPDHHLRPDVLPDRHLRPDVLSDRHRRPDVLPDHHPRPDVLLDRYLRPDVLPDHHLRPDVLPDHHMRPDILPDLHLTPDVLPDRHLTPNVPPNHRLTTKFCRTTN